MAGTEKLNKDRQKALCDLLVSEIRSDNCSLETLKVMIENGADVCFSHARPLKEAAKLLKTEVVELLIKKGSLHERNAARYVAQMCDTKNFNELYEEPFFDLIDLCVNEGAERIEMLTPYINSSAVNGKMDKISKLMRRYYLTEAEVASAVYIRIIFEIILNAHFDVLEFINKHVKWITAANFDLAVSSGDWLVLEYIISQGVYFKPSDAAVAQAVYEGTTEVLDILLSCGYSFDSNPIFLKKACRAAYNSSTRSLEYLLNHGYTLSDVYGNRTIEENALIDNNKVVLDFIIARKKNTEKY